ncbi:hypothetical protein JAAARDRAFT_256107 [Jaapia argillacea MUCL 33604]|uniref:Uncharacterized protein n=1 Tax=Jaapia argillacea MUCL 33604 TaxID=933084 RepID=A0A067PTC4_9AGAM|nr:hypothetical protein JAAARDRAFT_256107 [Jaapia argillacea MUCL 33604]
MDLIRHKFKRVSPGLGSWNNKPSQYGRPFNPPVSPEDLDVTAGDACPSFDCAGNNPYTVKGKTLEWISRAAISLRRPRSGNIPARTALDTSSDDATSNKSRNCNNGGLLSRNVSVEDFADEINEWPRSPGEAVGRITSRRSRSGTPRRRSSLSSLVSQASQSSVDSCSQPLVSPDDLNVTTEVFSPSVDGEASNLNAAKRKGTDRTSLTSVSPKRTRRDDSPSQFDRRHR